MRHHAKLETTKELQKRQLIAGIILLRASKCRETKTYKLETSVNL